MGLSLSATVANAAGLNRGGWIALGVMVGGSLSGAALAYVGFVRRCGWGLREAGFTTPTRRLWHLLWWIPLTLVGGAIGATILSGVFGLSSSPESASTEGFQLGAPAVVLLVACLTIVIPALEEIVFRRVLLDWCARFVPMWLAATIVTIAFAAAHVSPAAMVYLIFTSASLTLARLWFGSLRATLLIHAANNAVVSAIALTAF